PRANGKVRVVGNLMVDAAHQRVSSRSHAPNGARTIAIFPGSRAYQVRNMLPFLLQVAGDVTREVPGTRWLLAKSDFISREELASMAAARDGRVIEGETSRLEPREGGDVLISERGIESPVMSSAEAM